MQSREGGGRVTPQEGTCSWCKTPYQGHPLRLKIGGRKPMISFCSFKCLRDMAEEMVAASEAGALRPGGPA